MSTPNSLAPQVVTPPWPQRLQRALMPDYNRRATVYWWCVVAAGAGVLVGGGGLAAAAGLAGGAAGLYGDGPGRRQLRDLGCRYGQGFHMAAPLNDRDARGWLRELRGRAH